MCLLIARGIHMLLFTEEKNPNPKETKIKQPSFGLRKKHNIVNLIPRLYKKVHLYRISTF